MARQTGNDLIVNTIIGSGSFIQGTVTAGGFSRIDGSIRGDLTVKGKLVIGESGRIKGDIQCTACTLGGVVIGDILAPEGVVILSTGILIGTVYTKKIKIDEGAVIKGAIVGSGSPENWEERVATYRDAQSIREASRSGV
ncbi:MAG TPA: polymer-forming cytoskeletal protein [Termitinemataceae bacterium]|nr:polymer-forming cytoskeletal protein [Termitinemataceae bacterium]